MIRAGATTRHTRALARVTSTRTMLGKALKLQALMMALVAAGTLNSSAAYLSTAVNGASSGTLSLFGKGAGMEV